MLPRILDWRLGVAAWMLIAIFTRTGTTSSHEWSRLGTVESIVERQSFWLEASKFRGTRDKIYRDGHYLLAPAAAPRRDVVARLLGAPQRRAEPLERLTA